MIVLVMTVSLPASAQYYRNGRPIPPSKRASYYSQHQYGAGRDGDTYFGLRLGFGVSTVSSDNTTFDTNKSKTGLNVGVAVGTQLTSQAPVFFESGLYYTEKGGKSTHNGTRFTYNLDYLEAPLLVKYKVYPSRDVSVEPFFGGYLACGIAGKIKDYNNREAYSKPMVMKMTHSIVSTAGCDLVVVSVIRCFIWKPATTLDWPMSERTVLMMRGTDASI